MLYQGALNLFAKVVLHFGAAVLCECGLKKKLTIAQTVIKIPPIL